MTDRYIPQVREAAIPEDGCWTELQDVPVLLISIPEWLELMNQAIKGFQFVWMYDREQDAYLFCFRLDNKVEKAIAFAKDHGGLLLQNEKANGIFSIIITSDLIENTTAQSPYLLLTEIELKRHPQAGW